MKIKFVRPFRFVGNNPDDGSDSTVSVGHIVDLENDESARWLIDNGFAEEVKESGWWKPMMGDRYYFIDDSGYIKGAIWGNNFWDVDRYKLGNVFKTEEAAERYRDYMEAVVTVRQDEGVLTPEELMDKSRDKVEVYYVGFDQRGFLCPNMISLFDHDVITNAILFDTHEHALASRNKHPDEWKTIANYDWSRE